MILRRINLSNLRTKQIARFAMSILQNNETILSQNFQSNAPKSFSLKAIYGFSTSVPPMSQTKIMFQIQKATTAEELLMILNSYQKSLNFIHRTVLLQKATQRPFDQDEELVKAVINCIKSAWKYDYSQVSQKNARAIANTICYMSRKKKLHHLDSQFIPINYNELAQFLNQKEFVMTFNGLLKLQLTDEISKFTRNEFSLETFITENISGKFHPSLLVSMWFNLLKYHKSTKKINDFFANLLKVKHFKTNLIDYMQIVYCYVNSSSNRTVDLTYPVMTHPKEINSKNYIGAHQLSVLYEQLAKLKKITDVYFSQEFTDILENCYLRVLNEKDVPLRNIANVFNNMVQYENPTSKILQGTFHKYYTTLKNQIGLLQRTQHNRKPWTNVDSLSFVTLFNLLLEFHQSSNRYLNELVLISLNYIEKIVNTPVILNEYNERTFMRLLAGIDLAKKMTEQQNTGRPFTLTQATKFGLQKQLIKRNFMEVQHLGKLINFIHNHDIRSKQVCMKIKNLIESIPQQNQMFSSFQQRLKQKCILNKSCKNCSNCFSD